MANIFSVNVYQINSGSQGNIVKYGFSPSNVQLKDIPSTQTVTAGPSGTRVYGIIQAQPHGLQIDPTNYYVVETVAQLQTLANA